MEIYDNHPTSNHSRHGQHAMYGRLVLMLIGSFIAMYFLMYAMVDTVRDVMPNINQGYMVALMTAPMALLELGMMSRMYPDKRKNIVVALAAILLFVIGWFGMRTQAGIGDTQFLKSMIPHHSGALLMCKNAKLESNETRRLCDQIVRSQVEEIAQMRGLLARE